MANSRLFVSRSGFVPSPDIINIFHSSAVSFGTGTDTIQPKIQNRSRNIFRMDHLQGLRFADGAALKGYEEEELGVFETFKETMIKDRPETKVYSDEVFRRFLDADRIKGVFHIEESVRRMCDTIDWRRDQHVDNIRSGKQSEKFRRELSVYSKMRVRQFFGEDKFGRPVQFERLGGFFQSGNASERVLSENQWRQCYTWDIEGIFEEMRKSSVRNKKLINKYVYVGDLSEFSFSCSRDFLKHGVPLLKVLSAEIERFYPEIAGPIILINAPYVVWAIFKVVKVRVPPPSVSLPICSVGSLRRISSLTRSILPPPHEGFS